MINYLRTITARFIVRYLSGPPSLLVAAWGWLGLTGGAVGIAALLCFGWLRGWEREGAIRLVMPETEKASPSQVTGLAPFGTLPVATAGDVG
jgi:hypothetical protein